MTPLKLQTPVRQIVAPIEGVVKDARYDAQSARFQYLVAYTGADGQPAERWFDESEIQTQEAAQ